MRATWFGSNSAAGVSKYDGAEFTNYTDEDGLIGNRVTAIYQDKVGDMWFGTEAGLSRFDGQTFQNFTTADGLANNEISVILQDQAGDLWIGTGGPASDGGGISRYDGQIYG